MKKNSFRLLGFLLAAMMMVSLFGVGVFAGDTANVAKIGDTEYATLQAAITAAKAGDTTITLLRDCGGSVSIKQESGKNITVEGDGNTFSGTIAINGSSRADGAETLTFKNVEFNANVAKSITGSSYAHNVKFVGCKFVTNTGYQIEPGANYNWSFVDCSVSGNGAFWQAKSATNNLYVENFVAENGGNVFKIDYCATQTVTATFKNVEIKSGVVGFYISDRNSGTVYIEDCTVNCQYPVYIWHRIDAPGIVPLVFTGENLLHSTANQPQITGAVGTSYTIEGEETIKDVNMVAQIGDVKYETLQDAINACVVGNNTITLLADLDEDATIKQTEGVNITIDGNGKYFSGTLYVDGNGRPEGTETLTIKNVNFKKTDATTNAYFINAEKRADGKNSEPHNLTVEDCTFESNNWHYAIATRHPRNLVVKNCTANKVFYFIYNPQGGEKMTVEDCTVTNATYGIGAQKCKEVYVKNYTYTGKAAGFYGRAYAHKCNAVLENVNITTTLAGQPAVTLWKNDDNTTSSTYTFIFKGENVLTTPDGVASFARQIETNSPYVIKLADMNSTLTATEGLAVTTDVEGYEVIYENGTYKVGKIKVYVAQVGDVKYETLQDAINACVVGNNTITLLADLDEDATIKQTEGVNITIDGNGKYFSGTLYVDGNGRPEGTETLTIKNVNFKKTDATTNAYFINAEKRADGKNSEPHNLTVEDCTFESNNWHYAIATRHPRNLVVKNCTANKVFYFIYNPQGGEKMTVEDCTVTNATYGIGAQKCKEVYVKNYTYTGKAAGFYGRAYAHKCNAVLENVNITTTLAGQPAVTLWKNDDNTTSSTYTFIFKGENVLTTPDGVASFARQIETNSPYVIKLADMNSTLTATEGLAVTTDVEGYEVIYENGTYKVGKIKVYVAQVGDVKYETLQDALNACTNGETIILLVDLVYGEDDVVLAIGGPTGFGDYYNPAINYVGGTKGATPAENKPSNVNAVLDLNGHTITNNADAYLFLFMDNCKVTIKDSKDGDGIIGNTEAPVIWVTGTDTLVTIENGKYTTANAEGLLWSTHGGDLVIKGGEFSTSADDASLLIVRNAKDRRNPNYFIDGKATVTIYGGTFYGFDPEKTMDDSTDPFTEFNAVAEGYMAQDNGDNSWTVVLGKVYNATTGNTFATIADAVADAVNTPGADYLILLQDHEEFLVTILEGMTLDLQDKTLTATYVFAAKGGYLVGNSSTNNNVNNGVTAQLVVPKNNVALSSEAYYSGTSHRVLVWDKTQNAYVFSAVTISTKSSDGLGGFHLMTDELGQYMNVKFKLNASNYVYQNILTGSQADHGIKVVVTASWNTDTGVITQNLVFSDEDVLKTIQNSGWMNTAKVYLQGHDGLVMTVQIVTNTGNVIDSVSMTAAELLEQNNQ